MIVSSKETNESRWNITSRHPHVAILLQHIDTSPKEAGNEKSDEALN